MRFGKLFREKYFYKEIVLENKYSFYRIIIINQILDRENQEELSREYQIGKYNRKLYSRIIKELDKRKLIELRSIYYNYLIEKINQKLRNQKKDRFGN